MKPLGNNGAQLNIDGPAQITFDYTIGIAGRTFKGEHRRLVCSGQ